jgi:hypothetical protein
MTGLTQNRDAMAAPKTGGLSEIFREARMEACMKAQAKAHP